MRRRDFVQRLPGMTAGLAAGAATLSLGACAGASYIVPRATPGGVAIPTSALEQGGGVFVQSPEMGRPLWVARDEAGRPVALLASCTHQGCQPEPVGDRLVCPCHGSEFSRSGAVLQGPAERPLLRYDVVERDGEIFIDVTGSVGS